MNLLLLLLTGCAFAQLLSVRAIDLKYLDEKLRQSKKEFIKIHIQDASPVEEKEYTLRWDILWRVQLTSEYRLFAIDMFNRTFILDGNRLMMPSLNETSDKTLYEVAQVGEYTNIKFVTSIVWRDTVYLLLCYEPNLCSLHTGTPNATLRFRHTVRFKGTPVDAKFFTQHDQLYLIIANNADRFPVPSLIYRWSDTYMDVVQEVITSGVTSVTAFEYRRSAIIVFACYDAENPWIGSDVYEFKDDSIAKMQILSTVQPISVHHYVHADFNFVLVMNEQGLSNVFCWDGRELLDWSSLLEIEPNSLITIFHMDGDTFAIVAYKNVVELHKFHNASDWKKEDTQYFKEGQRVVGMVVSLHEDTIMHMTLIMKRDNVYWVEQWQVKMSSIPIKSSIGDAAATNKCLADLIKTLEMRMPLIREAEASWKLLPSATEEPIKFDSLIVQSGNVDNVVIVTDEDVLPPRQIERALNELDRNVSDLLSERQKVVNATTSLVLSNKIAVDELHVEELEIDQVDVDYLNDQDVRAGMVILSQGEQHFAHPLHVKSVSVDDLEVESLCGIPSEYWSFKNSETSPLDSVHNFVEYSNDSVILHSDLTVSKLNITSLNRVIVDEFIADLFMINRTQEVKGKLTYKKLLQIVNLTTETLNGVPADKLMTTTTNQSFDDFYMKTLEIDKLYAETINGVPVEEAARKSRNSVIKGKVKLATLHVTENFVVDANNSQVIIPLDSPLQIYENVTILGDLYLKNLKIENAATLFVEDNGPVNMNCIFDKLWTKSSNQTITEEVTLEGGLTVDRLRTKYLNGFAEDDFLYATMDEIPSDFANLHFENFHVDEFFHDSDPNTSFFAVEPYSLKISKPLHLSSLQATDLITSIFNGVHVFDVMEGKANFSGILEQVPTVQASRVLVDNLDVRSLNDREVVLKDRLRIDDTHQLTVLKVPEFHVRNLEMRNLNGVEMKRLTRLKDLTDLDEITIDGDLTVKNLTIGQIDGQTVESFFDDLKQNDIVIPARSIEDLIVRNITLKSLYGRNFDDFVANVISRSRGQTIRGHFSAHAVTTENVTMNFINRQNVSQLMWVDEPLTITGDVTFSNLYVDGDVITSSLNGRDVRELYDSLLTIPAKDLDLLKVDGSITWNMSRTSPASISYLLENAVTADTDQVITGNVIFEEDVHAWAVIGPFDQINTIRDIISDVVIDHGELVEIAGKKLFKNDFEADSLTVNGDLGIREINGVDIRKFNDSVVRKDREDTIAGPLTFVKGVKIVKLRANNADLNASISAAARSSATLPDNVFFEKLEVMGDVHLKNLDGIDFDEFMSQRVTLSGNNEIPCSMQFNGIVTVTGNANVKQINGIRPSEFVLNNVNETQKIRGEKSFHEDLVIDGHVAAPRINNMSITREYEDGVKNDDEHVDIFGDLIFKSNVRIHEVNTSGLVNGVNLRLAVDDLKKQTNEIVQDLQESWEIIEQRVRYSSQASKTLRSIFFYLETAEDLAIHGTNVSKVDVTYINETMIKLDMKNELPGGSCELPDHCPCPYQSTVELSAENTHIAWRLKHGEVTRKFRDQDGNFEISVTTTAVSSSAKCTLGIPKREYTVISISRLKDTEEILSVASGDIEGYLKDAAIFQHEGSVYAVLAINYEKTRATHRVDSLFYRVDVETENATLIQEFPTDGAWSTQIFEIEREMFLLVGCFGESAESLLYRFEPTIQKLELLRTFASDSRYVKHFSQGKDHFVLLDNPDTNAVNIYRYDPAYRNFYSYQSIFHASEVNGIEYFYADDFDSSDAFVIVTTQDGRFHIYEYMFAEKFQLRLQHAVDGLQTMVPFYYLGNHYIFAGTSNNNVVYRIVKQGPR
ncbi:hypothetical protein X777_06851 [Ooceraea biroi]|uniref:Uncharacterized protein n=1 Tax=Ooceraea biroi TaxID=2015173 RepID=A0A026WFE4_OOCBI|nr:hypothetical protein X777_06851 [Ooceraea biroi]